MDFERTAPTVQLLLIALKYLWKTIYFIMQGTFSSYKQHNAVKYSIGITPQGTVCYISNGWGGRVSDKDLTENSDILSHITPGDTILED